MESQSKKPKIYQKKSLSYEERLSGYTKDENPFNDKNLHIPFIWKAKYNVNDKKASDINKEDSSYVDFQQKVLDNQFEISKVRQSRLDRNFVRQVKDEEMLRVQKAKDDEYHQQWKRRINKLDKSQLYLRSKIRLENKNAKLIDWLAYLVPNKDHENDEIIQETIDDPNFMKTATQLLEIHTNIFDVDQDEFLADESKLSSSSQFESFVSDLELFKESSDKSNEEYWQSIIEISKLKQKIKLNQLGRDQLNKIQQIISSKTPEQLQILRKHIENKLNETDKIINTDYWENLLNHIDILFYCRILNEISNQKLKKRNENLDLLLKKKKLKNETISYENKLIDKYDKFNPSQMTSNENICKEANPICVKSCSLSLEEFRKLLPGATGLYLNEFRQPFYDEFIDENDEKLEGIKPKYFNIVTYIKNWNRYNQNKLEDEDQPLPKSVHRYYFNIYYPLLSKNAKTPYYTLQRGFLDKFTNESFALLTFHADLPYRDISFKIVDKKWQTDWKHGFKSQFSNNFLSLSFRFWQLKYRK